MVVCWYSGWHFTGGGDGVGDGDGGGKVNCHSSLFVHLCCAVKQKTGRACLRSSVLHVCSIRL